ncbi:MAG TPA: hypothetical protein VF493_04850 [Terriglobales bacterium]
MKSEKAMTIRLSADQAEALQMVATVEERSVAEIVRLAIDGLIDDKTKDPAFQDSLKERISRASRFLLKK